jgi:hypothetical protein
MAYSDPSYANVLMFKGRKLGLLRIFLNPYHEFFSQKPWLTDPWKWNVLMVNVLFYSCRPKWMQRPCCKALYWVLATPSANKLDLGANCLSSQVCWGASKKRKQTKWKPVGFALFHMSALYTYLVAICDMVRD